MIPRCVNCGKKLPRCRFRAGKRGAYGDGHFCGLNCGYRWAVMYLQREPDYTERLHLSMDRVMEATKKSKELT